MTPLPWFSIVGSTLCWAAFDSVRKHLVRKIPVPAMAFWIWAALLPGYAVWAAWEGHFALASGYLAPASLSFALNLMANVLFLESVQRGPLSVTVPILSFTPVFTALFGIPLLGEQLLTAQWAGIGVVTGSSLFLTREPESSLNLSALLKRFYRAPGVLPMLAVALIWSLTPLFDKLALRHATISLHGLLMALFGALGMALWLIVRQGPGALRVPVGSLPWIALGGAINLLALGLQLLAITQMVVSVFEAFKRAGGILIALLMGTLVFGERIRLTRAFAAVLMAGGVVLVLRA